MSGGGERAYGPRSARRQTKPRGPNFLSTPKGVLLIALLVLASAGCAYAQSWSGAVQIANAVATAVLIDVIVATAQHRKRIFPDGAAVTGLIVAMVLSPHSPWYVATATSALAVGSKHVLKINRTPMFNPAAFGLMASIVLMSSEQSWWGGMADWPVWGIALPLAAGYVVTRRVNKFPQAFAFLASFYLAFLVLVILRPGEAGEIYGAPFLNSVVFLAFFMVTDPPTSPGKTLGQVLFGAAAAACSVYVDLRWGGLSFLLAGLLTTNFLHFLYAYFHAVQRRMKRARQAGSSFGR